MQNAKCDYKYKLAQRFKIALVLMVFFVHSQKSNSLVLKINKSTILLSGSKK